MAVASADEDFCAQIRRVINWLNVLESPPVIFAEPGFKEDLETSPQPLAELYLVTQGQMRIDVRDKSVVLQTGDMALANAHFGNVGREVSGPYRYGCISLEVPFRGEFADWSRDTVLFSRKAPDPERMSDLFKEVAHVYHGAVHPLRGVLLKAYLLQVLVAAGDTGERDTKGSGRNPRVLRAVEIMTCGLADPALSLSTIARRVGVSPSQLVRVFQATFGQSPMHYLVDMRVRHAKSLLARSSLSIKEIAFMLGFRDQLYFSRVFRRQTGVSPLKFRERSS